MLVLQQLELQNFLSHVNTVLEFDKYKGLVLIEGINRDGHYSSNGSGKSTLLEGIVYALTGDTLRGVGVNDVINRNYKKNTKVTLRFLNDDVPYEISRYRKDEKMGDSIVLIKNGEDISKRVNKETQALIDDTLDISFKILVSTVLLGEGLSSKFTQLSDPDKKALIESTLNLSYDMNELRARANTKLSGLKLEVSNLEGRVEALKEYLNFDESTAQKEVETLTHAWSEKTKIVEEKNSKIGISNTEINQLIDKINLLKSSIDKIDYLNRDITNMDNENSRLVAELTNAEKCENPRCTVCHQELANEEAKISFRTSYKEKIDNLNTRMVESRQQIESLPDRTILVQRYEEFSSRVNTLRDEVSALTLETRQLQTEAYDLKLQADTLTANIRNYHEATTSIDNFSERLKAAKAEMEIYDYFYKLFSPTGIITDILSDAVGYINERISTYSEVLLDKGYKIEFKKGKISLVDESGASYQSLSNGEKRRLDIAIQFALHDYVVRYCSHACNIMFIDEILDTLDDTGVDNIFDVLRLKLEYCGLSSIYVITHNDTLKSKFDAIVTVVKDEKGDSTVL